MKLTWSLGLAVIFVSTAVGVMQQAPTLSAPEQRTSKIIYVGGAIPESKLIHKVQPKYPGDAKRIGIVGVARLDCRIGTDGITLRVTPFGGEASLAEAARQAVEQWRFQPWLLNGKPIEVATEIDVNFSLKTRRALLPMSNPAPLAHSDPPYTEAARAKRTEGRVRLAVCVDAQGNVVDVEEISDPLGDGLDDSAVATVRRWKFTPALYGTTPVAAYTSVDINFKAPSMNSTE